MDHGPAFWRQAQVSLSRVPLGPRAFDQTAFAKAEQDAAEISGIEAEIFADFRRDRRLAMCQLVEYAHFRKRERAVEMSFLEEADFPRIEAVEAADGLHRILLGRH